MFYYHFKFLQTADKGPYCRLPLKTVDGFQNKPTYPFDSSNVCSDQGFARLRFEAKLISRIDCATN